MAVAAFVNATVGLP